ncbi:MAG TPA: IS1182 family transposase [Candidatus Acidoferrales bacterium]|nr:IS1182 family transposase [Candidatus Acidoferrales bacterium]
MLGKRSPQGDLFGADTQYLKFVGEESFYGFLAREGRELFRDEEFAALYCPDNGRTSVPPSLLAMALLLQTHDRVSDEEAKARADFDLRWKVALGIEIDTRPFAKSTLQCFRAQLVIHEGARAIFRRSLEYAKGLGHLRGRRMRAALDTTHILGRGAQEDTYNLMAEGIRLLSRELAKSQEVSWENWLTRHELARYAEPSIKGAGEVDWDDSASREAFLCGLIGEGQRLLELARQVRSQLEAHSEADRRLAQAADLLSKLLWQDVEPAERGYRIKPGTAEDRIPSAHDPEQRHGHKSQGKTFTGHKAGLAVNPESQLITAVAVTAGNASDGESAVQLVEDSEENTGLQVEQVIGDTAYGSMAVREELGEREVIAPTVKGAAGAAGKLTKADFVIDAEADVVRCPTGEETRSWRWVFVRPGAGQAKVRVKRFAFAKEVCRACARRGECTNDKRQRGRLITLHPQETDLQAARAFEQTEHFKEQYRQRVVVEHRIARLVRLGVRQARYFGRAKTLVQLLLAATVANLTLIAGKVSPAISAAGEDGPPAAFLAPLAAATGLTKTLADLLGRFLRSASTIAKRWQLPPRQLASNMNPIKSPAFRPGF